MFMQGGSRGGGPRKGTVGFTLIELLVVMAIIATLGSIAAPRYFNSLEKTRETALRANLKVMREAIDQFYQDTGRWPGTLEDLVKSRYLREIPVDPVSRESTSWVPVRSATNQETGIRDVRSGAQGVPRDGTRYEDW
jgi:general secretion pathway protein G